MSTKPKYEENLEIENVNFNQAKLRPDTGTRGEPIQLIANYFRMTIPKDLIVHHYDLQFTLIYTAYDETSQTTVEREKIIKALPKSVTTFLYSIKVNVE